MRKKTHQSGFTLALTLVLMALIVIIVVAYLSSTRIERSTSSVYANRLRAKMTADSGLTAAIHLLKDNTRYGNYITAMPAPSPSPASIYTEIYRPTDPTSRTVVYDDYLRFDNAGGELLISLASSGSSPGPDARPTPAMVYPSPTPTPLPVFALPSPNPVLSTGNSYDFNQLITVGSASGRLVQPSPSPAPPPAYGQWVNVRDSNNQLVARYAFYIEDESMKLNVNVTGNASGSRTNDLTLATPSPIPDQIQEVDPSAILPMATPTPNRVLADTTLASIGAVGGRLSTRSTLGLLTEWKNQFPSYAHMTTVLSKDDNTTARGWQRLDLNAIAMGLTTNSAKLSAATTIANWIRDAWTGPGPGPTPIATLSSTQVFNDDRLRKQIAANIVDYIAPPGPSTDMSPPPSPTPSPAVSPVPVIGIEKIPYIHAIEIIFQAANTDPVAHTTTVQMKLQFRFLNMFESDLKLTDQIGWIQVQGLPTLTKNGTPLIDTSGTFTAIVSATPAASPSPSSPLSAVSSPNDFVVKKGSDGTSSSGARSFATGWMRSTTGPYTVPTKGADDRPRFGGGTLFVNVFGKSGERLDVIAITLTPANKLTGYYHNGSSSQGDFVEDATPVNGATQIACISLTDHIAGSTNTGPFGDPRYRPAVLTDRWDNDSRTDATCSSLTDCPWLTGKAVKPNRITSFIDTAEVSCRSYAVDWYDFAGDRPLAFIRNGQMLNIGELGNIATGEYPWRSLYLQHPERPVNTSDTPWATEVPLRRSQSVDYVLLDLFRVGGSATRSGAVNINTQQQFLVSGALTPTSPVDSLFLGELIGSPNATPTPQVLTQAVAYDPSPSPADRLSTGVNLLVSSTTVAQSSGTGTTPLKYRVASVSNKRVALSGETSTPDNNPPRPYFQIGELASSLSRLVSASEASDTTGSSSTSNVVYSALRDNPSVRVSPPQNYRRDFEVEQAFRETSNSITTRGNVFRILYVGQTIKDVNKNGSVDGQTEIAAEYLGEAFVERNAIFQPDPFASPTPAPGTPIKTSDSTYRIIANRVVTE